MAWLNGADGEAWIAERTKQDTGYRSETDQTRKTVASLEENTKDLVRTDLRELNTALEANKAVPAKLTETRKTHALRSEGHLRARDQIIRTARTEGKLREARKKIGHLNSIANGASGAGGKHTFDGYVYGRAFGEILDRAGIYLQEMTGGHYRLMHDRESANARKSARADFKVMVEDRSTHTCRKIGSTSGGEKFQIAMSLALGLSDTVQAHTSTIKIDTMFIDEGFGTLDMDSLHRMLDVLKIFPAVTGRSGSSAMWTSWRRSSRTSISVSGRSPGKAAR